MCAQRPQPTHAARLKEPKGVEFARRRVVSNVFVVGWLE
jgi:hypothetical protein